MNEPKRARDIQIGDVLEDGSVVYSVNAGVRGLNILSKRSGGTIRRLRYAADTILPGPDDRHPSRFKEGHPWTRKGCLRRSE